MSNPPTVGEGPEVLGSSAKTPIPGQPVTLLPCPFCGVAPRLTFEEGPSLFYAVQCETDDCLDPIAVRMDRDAVAAAWNTRAVVAAVGRPLSGHDRHLVEVDLPNGMRLTIVREDEYDAVTIWSEDEESIFTQADVPRLSAMIAATQQPDETDAILETAHRMAHRMGATFVEDAEKIAAFRAGAATQQPAGEGLSFEDHAIIARCAHNLPKLYRRGQHAGYYQHSDVSDLIDIIGRLAALSATQQPVSEGWRPIETAPRDGTHFLAVDECGDASRCAYHSEGYIVSFCGQPVVTTFEPTLWMPWPSTPNPIGEEKGAES